MCMLPSLCVHFAVSLNVSEFTVYPEKDFTRKKGFSNADKKMRSS